MEMSVSELRTHLSEVINTLLTDPDVPEITVTNHGRPVVTMIGFTKETKTTSSLDPTMPAHRTIADGKVCCYHHCGGTVLSALGSVSEVAAAMTTAVMQHELHWPKLGEDEQQIPFPSAAA